MTTIWASLEEQPARQWKFRKHWCDTTHHIDKQLSPFVCSDTLPHETMSSDGVPLTLLRHFDVSAPYPHSNEISARRSLYPSGQLFFDRLLQLADTNTPPTDWASLYPPNSPSSQRKLLQAIHDLPTDRLKRDCYIYYLLRDIDDNNNSMEIDGSRSSSPSASQASTWAQRRCIPRAWRTLMDGYWDLDHGYWDSAVEELTDPAIFDVNFLSEIVDALVTMVSPPSYALELVNTLLSIRPPTSQDASDAALLASANASMLEAFTRIRTQVPAERARSREAVWCWALGAPKSPAGKGEHTAQPKALKELLHLVLSDEEHAHLVHFLAHPPRDIPVPARSLLHDLVTLRLIHAGKYEETLALDKELSDGGADRQRRREMVREFIDILPAAQRRILLEEQGEKDWVVVETEDMQPEPPATATPLSLPAPNSTPAVETVQASVPASVPAAPDTPIAAPTPVRPNLATRVLGTPSRTGSGFGGPPRFAESPRIPPPSTTASQSMRSPSPTASPPPQPVARRQPSPSLVSSPFHPPIAPKPAPAKKQPKMILDDETPRSRRATAQATPAPAPGRARRGASPSPTPTASEMDVDERESAKPEPEKQEKAEESEPEEKPRLRRSTRRQSSEPPEAPSRYNLRAPSEAPSEPVIPEGEVAPTPGPKTRTRRIVRTAQPTKRTTRAASRASTAEPEEEEMPPPKIPGAFEISPKTSSRTTKAKAATKGKSSAPKEHGEVEKAPSSRRSAARAALDEPEDTGAKRGKARPKRTTRAQSVASTVDDDAEEPTPRRSRRAATASERGSPTPSVASSAASPSAPARRTRTATSTRVTRSRK